ncbi:MAG: hypothetical protein IPL22_09675 [Bacteroidetes bacterium]|nr:hypothetical protein [Bacteroidota bacterium]
MAGNFTRPIWINDLFHSYKILDCKSEKYHDTWNGRMAADQQNNMVGDQFDFSFSYCQNILIH